MIILSRPMPKYTSDTFNSIQDLRIKLHVFNLNEYVHTLNIKIVK